MKNFISLFFLTLSLKSFSQNLIANGSFEDIKGLYDVCDYEVAVPSPYRDGIKMMTGNWFVIAISPDIQDIHAADTVNCPFFFYGSGANKNLTPFHGDRCLGFYLLDESMTVSELTATQLTTPAHANKPYYVSAWVLQSEFSEFNFANTLTFRFSSERPQKKYGQPEMDLVFEKEIGNTTQWEKLDSCFIPKKDINYLALGYFGHQGIQFSKNKNFDSLRFYSRTRRMFINFRYTPDPYIFIDSVALTPLNIEGYAPVELGPRDTLLCQGQPIHYDLSHIKGSFVWQDGSTSPVYTITEPGTYWVEMTIGPNCKDRDTISVWYSDVKVEIFGDTLGCEGGPPLTLESRAEGTIWQDSIVAQKISVSKAGVYTARSALAPCQPQDSIEVRFQDCGLFIPNVFTPNGDGVNDTWMIDGLERARWRVSIFNRYGQEVYHSQAYQGLWDGGGLPEAVYYYHLQSEQAGLEYRGWVMLAR